MSLAAKHASDAADEIRNRLRNRHGSPKTALGVIASHAAALLSFVLSPSLIFSEARYGHANFGESHPDLPYDQLTKVESSDTCPKPLENYCQSTGVINIGFYKSHVVLKEKYLGFQPSTSSDSSAEAVSIRPASMEAAGTTESRLNDAIMLLVNVAHLFGIHPATVVAWHKLHWDQLSTGKRNEGKFAKDTWVVPVCNVSWVLSAEQEMALIAHAITDAPHSSVFADAGMLYTAARALAAAAAVPAPIAIASTASAELMALLEPEVPAAPYSPTAGKYITVAPHPHGGYSTFFLSSSTEMLNGAAAVAVPTPANTMADGADGSTEMLNGAAAEVPAHTAPTATAATASFSFTEMLNAPEEPEEPAPASSPSLAESMDLDLLDLPGFNTASTFDLISSGDWGEMLKDIQMVLEPAKAPAGGASNGEDALVFTAPPPHHCPIQSAFASFAGIPMDQPIM